MANHNWEKEDRHCWQKSEVMQNFEKTILENYAKLSTAQQKMTMPQVKEMKATLDGAAASAEKLNKALTGSPADDGAIEAEEGAECAVCSFVEDEITDKDAKEAKASVLSELQKMAEDAISAGNIKLAYQVERTIAELLDEE